MFAIVKMAKFFLLRFLLPRFSFQEKTPDELKWIEWR
jgi:hypothetical protein